MAEALQYDVETLFVLEPTIQPTPPLPTRWWTGRGTLQFDAGDGAGTQSWIGSSFGDTQVSGVSAVEATADGVPQRMSISIALDETRDDIKHSATSRDLGPVAVTILFVYRETGTEAWSLMSDGADAKTIKGRSAQSTFEAGMWAFEIERRVHDADRLAVDVWSDAVQRTKHTGDRFFEFAASVEEGLQFDWPS